MITPKFCRLIDCPIYKQGTGTLKVVNNEYTCVDGYVKLKVKEW